ncbi:MAG TPA: hypothetical protein VFQ92_08125 [Blastocatellia bacterium]|nr:hypothetical protein [Blastocatellia bacterium]
MKTQRIAIALTLINLVIVSYNLAQTRPATAEGVAPVLRGRSLEIVDDQGRVRASIKIHPEDKTYKQPDGKTGYPETVMFRLIDANGRPEVKLGASAKGGGLGLLGDTDSTRILLEAEGRDCLLRLTNSDGRQQLIKP